MGFSQIRWVNTRDQVLISTGIRQPKQLISENFEKLDFVWKRENAHFSNWKLFGLDEEKKTPGEQCKQIIWLTVLIDQ